MKRSSLTEKIAHLCTRPLGTVNDRFDELQVGGLITKGARGRNGGAEMTASDRTNLLLACALDHPRGVPLAESVRKLRSLAPYIARQTHRLDADLSEGIRGAFNFLEGLSMAPMDPFGDVLDGILSDLGSGAFGKWTADTNCKITLEFSKQGTAALLVIDKDERGVFIGFGVDEEFRPAPVGVERVVRIYKTAFERLAVDNTT